MLLTGVVGFLESCLLFRGSGTFQNAAAVCLLGTVMIRFYLSHRHRALKGISRDYIMGISQKHHSLIRLVFYLIWSKRVPGSLEHSGGCHTRGVSCLMC